MLLPVLMLVVALLLQPALVLYTRSVMWSAATQTARAAAISTDGSSAPYLEFCKRRLAAVPPLEIFHTGGEQGWRIEVKGAGSGEATVHVEGSLRPIPLLGVVASVFGRMDGALLTLEVDATSKVGPVWKSGGYESWISMWK